MADKNDDLSIEELNSDVLTDKDLFDYLSEIVGKLNKTKYKQRLGEIYGDNYEVLLQIRENLYQYACRIKIETPTGRLVRRTNIGSVSSTGKLKEDIYILYYYIDGGCDVIDIKGMLSGHSNTDLTKPSTPCLCGSGHKPTSSPSTPLPVSVINITSDDVINTSTQILSLKRFICGELHSLYSKMEQLHEERRTEIGEIRNILKSTKQENNRLKMDNIEILKKEEETRKKLEIISEDNVKLKVVVDDINAENRKLIQDVEKLTTNCEELKSARESNSPELLEVEYSDMETRFQNLSEKYGTLVQEKEKLIKKLDSMEATFFEVLSNSEVGKAIVEDPPSEQNGFSGVPKVTKIVVSRVYADRNEDDIMDCIHEYAMRREIDVGYMKVLKYRDNEGYFPTYTILLHVYDYDVEKVLGHGFWPDKILARQWDNNPRQRRRYD